MLAYILGVVGTFLQVFLIVYCSTCLPISIEIGLYLTSTERKIGWHTFETWCILCSADNE